MNYRSVVVVGVAERLRDPDEARRALACVVNHAVPGRTEEARPPSEAELRQTAVLRVPIDTASVKVRTGGPREEPADLELPIWGGLVPMQTSFGTPTGDDALLEGIPVPASLVSYRRPGAAPA